MDQPIFESSILFHKVQVFDDHILYVEGVFKKQHIVYLKEISSIDTGLKGITIETSGGNKILLPIKLKDRPGLLRAIAQARREKTA